MPLAKRKTWTTWAILALSLAGCQGLFRSPGLPQDPLFVMRKPTEVKALSAPPAAIAYSEPALPRDPFALNQPDIAQEKNRNVPGTLTNRPGTQP